MTTTDAERWNYQVMPEHQEQRLDVVLAMNHPAVTSRSQWQQWIREGYVSVEGKRCEKASLRVRAGMRVEAILPPPEPLLLQPEPIPLDIVYEDDAVLVVNKRRGMVVHPAAGHWSGTLVHALLYHFGQRTPTHTTDWATKTNVIRPGIVHRIDKDTSGLLVVAKQEYAREHLAKQLLHHGVLREYVAIACGVLVHRIGMIDAPLGRDPDHRQRYTVRDDAQARAARTHFSVLEKLPRHTLVALRLETGRTHQIRVHLRYIGHPIVGDPVYGGIQRGEPQMSTSGQALHAGALEFVHPITEQRMHFTAPMPEDMATLLHVLRMESKTTLP